MAKLKTKRNRRIAPPPHLDILEDISTLISHSHDLQDTLERIVATVADRMQTEVCSIYILDRRTNRLTLRATMGLDPESVGKVSMGISEGLTGLVIERMKPVMVAESHKMPRTASGLPLVAAIGLLLLAVAVTVRVFRLV